MDPLRSSMTYGLILTVLILAGASALVAVEDLPTQPPNVVLIVADDLGYGDTSVYGGWVHTPQLERMAREGLKFTDFHSNSSVCSPTRAALLTGRYQQRVGIVDVVARHLDTPGLEPTEHTLPSLLRAAGYRTALFGKWHLGQEPRCNPVHHGFDEFRGYLDGYIDYHAHERTWMHGLQVEDQPGYSTHVITRNAVDFIRQQGEQPFFLMVAHEAVHLPFQTPDDTPDKREPIPKDQQWSRDRIRPKYRVMLEELDRGVGEILDALKQQQLDTRTVVFFMSDNGAIGAGSNLPFRGNKFSHYEGGHRVPAIAWWPGRIQAGTICDQLTVGMDLLPTFLQLAGQPLPERPLDGVSLAEVWLTGQELPQRPVYFGYEPKLGTALREGDWKLIDKAGQQQLFNLKEDPGERNDLAEVEPARLAEMARQIAAWKEATQPVVNGGDSEGAPADR